MEVQARALKGPWLAEGWATPLASSVTVPDPTEVPVQVLEAVKNVNVTVPVGVPKLQIGRASCREREEISVVAVSLKKKKEISVAAGGVRAVTSIGLQAEAVIRYYKVTGVQTWTLPISALKGPWLAEGWATPLASSVTVPDPTEVPVQVLEAVKNVNVTVPVGVPKLPLTVALSCTVDPAGTDVTTAWLAL